MRKGFPHCRGVEIKLPAANSTNTTFSIPPQDDIRYARILAIETYTINDMAKSQPSNIALVSGAQMIQCSLVLETNDADDIKGVDSKGAGRFTSTQQNIKYMPLAGLHRVQNSTPDPFVRQLMEFDNLYITWEKSFILVNGAGLGNVTDVAVYLQVYYSWLDINGIPITR